MDAGQGEGDVGKGKEDAEPRKMLLNVRMQ